MNTSGTARTAPAAAGFALLLGAFTLLGCSPLTQAHATPQPGPATATVIKVVDGDTVDVRDDQRGRLRIRILGIDAPESVKRGYTIGCYGQEAAAHAHTELDGRRVAIVTDSTLDSTDRYGRTLAYVVRDDGYDYGTETVRSGFAKSYIYDHTPGQQASAIADAEHQAQQRQAGLWGPPCNGQTESVRK